MHLVKTIYDPVFIEFSGKDLELKRALKFIVANCLEGRKDIDWEFAFPHDDDSTTIKAIRISGHWNK